MTDDTGLLGPGRRACERLIPFAEDLDKHQIERLIKAVEQMLRRTTSKIELVCDALRFGKRRRLPEAGRGPRNGENAG